MHPIASSTFVVSEGTHCPPTDPVEALVGRVIAMLRQRGGPDMRLDERRIAQLSDRLVAAALAPVGEALADLMEVLRREGLHADAVAETLIPAAAREFGRAWSDDRLSFVDVSLGMTRIQRLLRDPALDVAAWGGPATVLPASILVVMPEGEQHTLGGLIAARQLRRLGVAAAAAVGEKPRMLSEMLRMRRFDAVFVSVATTEGLERARKVVNLVAVETAKALPCVVGGAVLCATDQTTEAAVWQATGAHLVTGDVPQALAALDIPIARKQTAETA